MTIVEFRYNEHVPVTETRLADLDGNCNDVSFELPSHRSQPLSLFFFFFFKLFYLASYLILPCSPKTFPMLAHPYRITTVISK